MGKKLKEEQAKADLEDLRADTAEKRAKISETSGHNTDHKNERTPDDRTKPQKTKTGASRP